MKRIYISGPMTGIENLNREEFEAAVLAIRNQREGLIEVTSPIEKAKIWQWNEYTSLRLIADVLLGYLVGCDAIYMLRGWEQSKGARAEHAVAVWVGLEIMYQGGEG